MNRETRHFWGFLFLSVVSLIAYLCVRNTTEYIKTKAIAINTPICDLVHKKVLYSNDDDENFTRYVCHNLLVKYNDDLTYNFNSFSSDILIFPNYIIPVYYRVHHPETLVRRIPQNPLLAFVLSFLLTSVVFTLFFLYVMFKFKNREELPNL